MTDNSRKLTPDEQQLFMDMQRAWFAYVDLREKVSSICGEGNVLANTAYSWACDYISAQDGVNDSLFWDGVTDDEWDQHFEFICDCFANNVKPVHFLDVLLDTQRRFNDLTNGRE